MLSLRSGFCCGVLLITSFGCTAGMTGGDKLSKFHAEDQQVVSRAPKSGDYVVVYRYEGFSDLWKAKGTRRKVEKGEELGFSRDDMGRLVAIAGKYETTLGPLKAQGTAFRTTTTATAIWANRCVQSRPE